MSYKLTIYTVSNWQLLMYMFPNGTHTSQGYAVSYAGIDVASRLNRLRLVSPYLADVLAVYSDETGVILSKGF